MSSRSLHFEWVDVFSDRPFAGNPLAVFTRPGELSAGWMQTIARELNLAETTFVGPTSLEGADFRVRIFTPTQELPMAGHPTIGTAHVLASRGLVERREPSTRVVFEEGVGPIPVEVEWRRDGPGRIVMTQPEPTFGRVLDDRVEIARLLGLGEADLADLPAQVVSTGPPFLFVALSSLAAAEAATLQHDVWRDLVAGTDSEVVYVFSLETNAPEVAVHGRMFAPSYGIPEDPATGAAAGPLGAYLVEQGVVEARGDRPIVIEQGVEMGRPSRLEVEVERSADGALGVRVGGRAASLIEGRLELPVET